MDSLTSPLFNLIGRTEKLRRLMITSAGLALLTSVAEVAVAISLIPIVASLGVDAGGALDLFVARLGPIAWLCLFAAAAVFRSWLNWLSAVQEEHGTQELVITLQSRLYRSLAGAHWDAIRRVSPPVLTSALQTQAYDAGYGFGSLISLVSASLLVLAYLGSSLAIFPLAFPALLVVLVLLWYLNARRKRRVIAHSEDYHDAQTGLHQRYEDWVAISRISSLGVEPERLAGRFESDARNAASHAIHFNRSYAATRASYEAAVILTILVGVPIAWWLETPPALLAFSLVLLVRVLPQAAAVHNSYLGLVNAVAPIRNIERLATHLESDPARQSPDATPLEWRDLALTGVKVIDNLRDGGERPILHDISLELAHGEWLALTGPTGAGKTTLADVMLTLVRPDAGRLQIDGRDVDDLLAGRWRDQASYVPQDVVLFDASIRDNLRLHVPDATDEILESTLRRCAADFVFERLPNGLDTRVGPGGRWLSGGERQRIGIARALLPTPGFLVLDEPTASLDAGTEAKLMQALAEFEHTMSVVVITHRADLFKLADRVIEIEDGTIRH